MFNIKSCLLLEHLDAVLHKAPIADLTCELYAASLRDHANDAVWLGFQNWDLQRGATTIYQQHLGVLDCFEAAMFSRNKSIDGGNLFCDLLTAFYFGPREQVY